MIIIQAPKGKGFLTVGHETRFSKVSIRNEEREEIMKVKHIDHIGIAVKGIEQAGKFYTDILGA